MNWTWTEKSYVLRDSVHCSFVVCSVATVAQVLLSLLIACCCVYSKVDSRLFPAIASGRETRCSSTAGRLWGRLVIIVLCSKWHPSPFIVPLLLTRDHRDLWALRLRSLVRTRVWIPARGITWICDNTTFTWENGSDSSPGHSALCHALRIRAHIHVNI